MMTEHPLQLTPFHFPLLGNSVVIGIVSLMHITFASLAVGFTVLAPICEWAGQRQRHYLDLAHGMTRFTVVTFTASTVLAVIMVELFIGLFPLTNSLLFNQFRFPIYLAIGAFLIQLFALYPYYHYWDRLRARNGSLHLGLGAVAAASILVWVAVLDGIGSYMLTPVDATSSWSRLLNPTWIPLMAHRFVGNFVLAGYVIGGYAAWRLQAATDPDDEAYYLLLAKLGILVGVISLLLQPITGAVYGLTIQHTAPEAYRELTVGAYRPFLYVQFTLIGALFLGSQVVLRAAATGRSMHWVDGGLAVGIAVMLASISTPDRRRVLTFGLVAMLTWSLYAWGSRFVRTPAGTLKRPLMRLLCITLAFVALSTYLVMGTIRETARRPDTVRGVLSLQEEARTPAAYREGD